MNVSTANYQPEPARNPLVLWIGDDTPERAVDKLVQSGIDVERAMTSQTGLTLFSSGLFDLVVVGPQVVDGSRADTLEWIRTREPALSALMVGPRQCDQPLSDDDIVTWVLEYLRVRGFQVLRSPRGNESSASLQRILGRIDRLALHCDDWAASHRLFLSSCFVRMLADGRLRDRALAAVARGLLVTMRVSEPWTLIALLRQNIVETLVREERELDPTVATILARLSERGMTWRASTLAAELRLDVATVRDLLHRHTGVGFREWRCLLRLRPVLPLLAYTNEHIAQIAYQCGIQPSQLDRDFARILGLSPKAFRHICRSSGNVVPGYSTQSAK